jgi:Ca-activated chloride channel family protein
MDGSPLPGATVALSVRERFPSTVLQSDLDGVVEFSPLEPASYTLTATMPGYAVVRKPDVLLGGSKATTVLLPLGAEIVEVEQVVANLETVTSTTFGDQFIQDLPVQARFATDVIPGAVWGVSGGIAGGTIELDTVESAGTESYAPVGDNPFHRTADEPLSTFSADVDTASYSNVRRFLESGQRPPADAVRIEELINYFDYEHPKPEGSDPFGVDVEVAECPWQPAHRLARITLAARREARADYPGSNLVFLLDVSGSMQPPNKLPLLQKALGLLVDQLDARDSVSIVVYAGAEGLALPPTPGSDRATILEAIARLEAGGSTAGASGLRLAYEQARAGFIPGGVNRVVLATDGDFNVGVTSPSELLDVVAQDAERGIFLTVLGFGDGNLKDDRLEHLADHGNGNYAYIDGLDEARKVLVEEIGGTLVTVAKDVKFQVEFNPLQVAAYRLIGYSNRLLAHRDFNDDTKDAGEVGVGHTVTVLYEIEPAGPDAASADEARQARREVDPLRYRRPGGPSKAAESGELLTLKVRFKRPAESSSELRTYAVHDDGLTLGSASEDFRFAAAVAAFGMRLRGDAAVASFEWAQIRELAGGARTSDEHGHRAGFLRLVDSTQGAR